MKDKNIKYSSKGLKREDHVLIKPDLSLIKKLPEGTKFIEIGHYIMRVKN